MLLRVKKKMARVSYLDHSSAAWGVPASVGPYLTSSTLSDGLVSDFVGCAWGSYSRASIAEPLQASEQNSMSYAKKLAECDAIDDPQQPHTR